MNNEINLAVQQSVKDSQHLLADFLANPDSQEDLLVAFGDNFALNHGLSEIGSLLENDFGNFPQLEIRPAVDINDAQGAYSSSNNTIYLSQEFVTENTQNKDAISEVIIEEFGHYLDFEVNTVDAPGDEGAIFASLVTEEDLNNSQLANLQAEDDRATVVLDGEAVTLEQQDGSEAENDFGIDVPPIPGRIIYVNQNATGNNDGSSWENAYTDLQPALAASDATNEIWVAAGTYFPTTEVDREQTFAINNGAQVYGGFAGTETERSQRNILENRVTLSGDIGVEGDRTDNSYNVVTIADNEFPIVLDGFTIVDGQADGGGTFSTDYGGGIYIEDNADVVNLSNLIIANNQATFGGSGIYQSDSIANFNNVAFLNNTGINSSGSTGGALFAERSVTNITNSLFVNNSAVDGGAISTNTASFAEFDAKLNIANSTFVRNQADEGGVIYNSPFGDTPIVTIENSIFELNPTVNGNLFEIDRERIAINNSLIQGGFDGTGENIIDADPLFTDLNNSDFSLQAGSPAVDAGNNEAIEGFETDLVGNPRINNERVDIGAFESGAILDEGDIAEPSTVYRFFNTQAGVHFYTASEQERESISGNLPQYDLEGASFISAPASDDITGVAPVYRFLNTDTGVHLYTISEAERDAIQANLPNYQFEDIAYYGYTEELENTTPLYRFYNPVTNAHFYTPSAAERDEVSANLPNYQPEGDNGIAFYVQPVDSELPPSLPIPPAPPMDESPAESSSSFAFASILELLDNALEI